MARSSKRAEEPTAPETVAAWIEAARREHDPFEMVRRASNEHRERHGRGCTVYPTSSGPLLTVLTSAVQAERVLEVGCGLSYSALCLARGARGRVGTIEREPEHARLAEIEIERQGYGDRIRVLRGPGRDVLPQLRGHYDLIFFDGDPEEMPLDLDYFLRLVRPGGLIVSANLLLAQFVPTLARISEMAEYRERLLNDPRLITAILPGGLTITTVRGTDE